MKLKICTKCNKALAISSFAVRRSQCKSCRAKYLAAYRTSHKASIKATKAIYVAANKDRIALYESVRLRSAKRLAAKSLYRVTNRERIHAKTKIMRLVNEQKIKQRSAKYYAANKKRLQEKCATWKCRQRMLITDAYIKGLVCKNLKAFRNYKDKIPRPLIEALRAQLRIRILIKEKRNEGN